MVNNLSLQTESFVYKKRRRLERNIMLRSKKKKHVILNNFFRTYNHNFIVHNS